jgi:two-component system response regulator ChvI
MMNDVGAGKSLPFQRKECDELQHWELGVATMTSELSSRILLVDDDPLLLEAGRLALEAEGFICSVAPNGFEALKAIRSAPPDIVICDLRMPNMSGFELLPVLRRRYPELGVIVTSSEPEDSVRSTGLPLNAYLRKGEYTQEQLIATIECVNAQLRRLHPPESQSDQAPKALW